MGMIRAPAVAGSFYPAEPEVLAAELRRLLDAVPEGPAAAPKAIIAPHAGYVYSGPIAATVYARLQQHRSVIRRVLLIGPAHRVAFQGIAISTAEAFETPLGRIPVDDPARRALLAINGVSSLDVAHAQEHSLEVHLPFLQAALERFTLVPLVVGQAPEALVADLLEALWGGDETLIVISSDLSHYQGYGAAQAMDARTCTAIERLEPGAIGHDQACGRIPIGGLLSVARRRGLTAETLDLRNSGDTAGPRDRVVGYGAWAFREGGADPAAEETDSALSETELRPLGPFLVGLARRMITRQLSEGQIPTTLEGVPLSATKQGACFVTLKRHGQLRGCIGSPMAWRGLIQDVVDNALGAALRDPRFPPVTAAELPELRLSVSVLTVPRLMRMANEIDLLTQLRPRIDGLIIADGPRRALFLPAVWESLPDRRDFLDQLRIKAGLPSGHWSPGFTAQRFTAIEFSEPD